jgi:hypothetical protein
METLTFTRRTFVIHSLAGAGALAAAAVASQSHAQAALSDTDPLAVSLGYKSDGSKTDKTKYPKYAAGQACANCAIFQGKAGDAAGVCPLFAAKQVSAKGWCSACAKKA